MVNEASKKVALGGVPEHEAKSHVGILCKLFNDVPEIKYVEVCRYVVTRLECLPERVLDIGLGFDLLSWGIIIYLPEVYTPAQSD